MMTDSETIALRATVIADQRYDDDFTVIWRGMSIGRMMKASGGIARSVIVGTVKTLREPVVSAAQHIGLMETTRRIAERGLLAAMKLLEVQINLLRLIRISSEVVRRVWVARAHSQYRAPNFFRKAIDVFRVPRKVFDKLRQGERLAS